MKCFRVRIVLEFDRVTDPDDPAIDPILDGLGAAMAALQLAHGADAAWVDDADVEDDPWN